MVEYAQNKFENSTMARGRGSTLSRNNRVTWGCGKLNNFFFLRDQQNDNNWIQIAIDFNQRNPTKITRHAK